ncbi:MAG: HlyD family efflux transporter periplasmic adaptor subunit, partial [Heliobacteriaceae bacterium]|nr:HlyD family efflux transporter periplasmic adaptor subunit [Heliobacteriaceae bacterium]
LYNKKSRQEQVLDIISREDYERTLSEISRYEQESSRIQASLKEIEFKSTQQRLVSPVDGYVNTLLVHTIGGVVTPAKEILSVVPADSPITAKVRVLNKDIGYIKEGMPVQIKIDTFEFQKYGMIKGVVKKVSKDSIEDEKEGLVYDVYIEPLEKTLTVDGKALNISTGMSLSAEIKVDKRRIIEFFIYPIVKHWSEAVSVK